MKYFIILNLFLYAPFAKSICPDVKKNETAADCPWAQMARQIVDQKNKCEIVFKKSAPFIFKQFEKDKKSSEFLSLWGQAKNFDENAKSVIVDQKILECLAIKLNLKNAVALQDGFETVHAGLQHTYAYLFSQIETPYGYKRARWTGGELESGFGLSQKALNPETKNGSFLANVTYFFARWAFQDDSELINKLKISGRKFKSVSKELMDLKTDDFQVVQMVESVLDKPIILHTTFVKMDAKKLISKNTHLLVYWVEDTLSRKKYLITGFPVETSFVDRVLDEKNLGSKKVITTHYNAWIPELADSKVTLLGLRKKLSDANKL